LLGAETITGAGLYWVRDEFPAQGEKFAVLGSIAGTAKPAAIPKGISSKITWMMMDTGHTDIPIKLTVCVQDNGVEDFFKHGRTG
jgi:hypothetical protein